MVDTQYSGTSNPPNGGQVLDIANPEANDATVSQTAAAPTPQSSTPSSAQGQVPVQPQMQPQTPGQPQNPAELQGKQPNLAKTPGQQVPNGPAPTPTQNPSIQRAGMLHGIAETLSGGPRYAYSVDADGNMQKQKVPVSNAHIALAIALEAITGGITGLANGQGPNGRARAALAGLQQGQQQIQQPNQQARQQAQEDFNRRAQTFEMNMRLYNNARALGKMDFDAANDYVGQYKDIADKIQSEFPGYVEDVVSYKDLSKYNVTQHTAIPYKVIPRLDSDGKQVEINGRPQWDINYLVMKPDFKTTGLLTKDGQDILNRWHVPGMDNPNIQDSALEARLALNKMSMATQLGVAEHVFGDFFNTVNQGNTNGVPATDLTKTGTLNPPKIASPIISNLIDSTADKYADQVSDIISPDNFKALIRGIVQHESGGNPNAQNSGSSAAGLMQLTKATAQTLGVTNPFNPQQNVDGGTKLFAQYLKQYKNPQLALAAFAAGPGAVKDGQIVSTQDQTAAKTKTLVNQVSSIVGLSQGQAKNDNINPAPSPGDFAKNHPTFASDVEKFMGAYQSLPPGSEGQVGAALAHLRSSGQEQAANNVAAFLVQNDSNAIKIHDDSVIANNAERKADIQTHEIEARAEYKAQQDAAAQQQKQDMLDTFEQAKIPANALQMDPKDLVQNLQSQGVTIPSSVLHDALAVANYDEPQSEFANRNWFKDKTFTQGEVADVIKQLNPSYNESNYTDLKKYNDPNSLPSKTISAAAGVSNHLNMLLDAAKEVSNNGNGSGQFPLLNKLENEFNYHTGGTAYSRLAALTNAVNGEMGKVLSGGFAPDKEQVTALMKNMTPENSLQQIQSLAHLYTGIMHGKIEPFDETYSQLKNGQHLQTIPASLTKLFQTNGYETPWAKNQVQNNQNQQKEQPVIVNGKTIGYTLDGKTISRLAQ